MITFAVVGHRAVTRGDFSLNDLPGGAGRIDILCRCLTTSLFLSHDMRRDVECLLVLLGEPDPPKTIRFSGKDVRYLSPDERSAASLMKKALLLPVTGDYSFSMPGVAIRRGGLVRLLEEQTFAVLDESGEDIRTITDLPQAFLLSDHENMSPEEKNLVMGLRHISVGPRSLHAEHAITLVLNELDRRRS